MVLVALHERALTVEQRRFPCRLRGGVAGTAVGAVEVHTHAVGLGVGLVEHVDAILVAEVVPQGRLRIVACAHGVEVVLLEHTDIAHHGLAVYHMSVGLMVFVDVGAVDFHRFAVYEQLAVAYFHRAESYTGRCGLHNVALGVFKRQHKGVEVGGVVAPGGNLRHAAAEFHGSVGGGAYGFRLGEHLLAGGVEERKLQLRAFGRLGGCVGHLHVDVEGAVAVALVETGAGEEVGDALGSSGIKVDVAVDTAETPEILVFPVGAVGPAIDLTGQAVDARMDVSGNVECGGVLGALHVAGFLAVDPHIHAGRRAVEMQEYIATGPVGGNVEGAHIASHGVVVVGDVGRIGREGVIGVGIDGRAVALHFPVGGNFDVGPLRCVVVRAVKIHRTVGGFGGEVELPAAVQAFEPGRVGRHILNGKRLRRIRIGGSPHGLASHGEHFGILPVGSLGCTHGHGSRNHGACAGNFIQ